MQVLLEVDTGADLLELSCLLDNSQRNVELSREEDRAGEAAWTSTDDCDADGPLERQRGTC